MNVAEVAKSIWQAGVDAVKAESLLQRSVNCEDSTLRVADKHYDLSQIRRIEILGCGKAGRGMAAGIVKSLSKLPESINVAGWINVPADCAEPLATSFTDESPRAQQIAASIEICSARPAGINEPTAAAIAGTNELLNRLHTLPPVDLTIFLISGGGSALLESPREGVSLEDLLQVTRLLARSGATIQELNTVRTQLSTVKGGGVLRRASDGQVHSLIISDIIGDPLSLIASGPTVPSTATSADAVTILKRYARSEADVPASAWKALDGTSSFSAVGVPFQNSLIGTNAVAREAAMRAAEQHGFEVVDLGSENSGEASDVGRGLAERLQELKATEAPGKQGFCVLAGGETTVSMNPGIPPGKGGRNQEAALAALDALPLAESWRDTALVCGGTDGEDGPTDAAGGMIFEAVAEKAQGAEWNVADHLARHDSYPVLESIGGLLKTGPTHTNVMDLAVGVVRC